MSDVQVTINFAPILVVLGLLAALAVFAARYELAALLTGKRDGTHRRGPRVHTVKVDPDGNWFVDHSWSLLGMKFAWVVNGSVVVALFRGPGCVRRAVRFVNERLEEQTSS